MDKQNNNVSIEPWGKIEWIRRPENELSNMSIGIYTVDKGRVMEEHVHFSDEQCIISIRGEGFHIIDGKKVPFRDNDVNYLPCGVTHEIVNTGNEPIKQLYISSPVNLPIVGTDETEAEFVDNKVANLHLSEDELRKYIKGYLTRLYPSIINKVEFPVAFYSTESRLIISNNLFDECLNQCTMLDDFFIKDDDRNRESVSFGRNIEINAYVCGCKKVVYLCQVKICDVTIGYIKCGCFADYDYSSETTKFGILRIIYDIALRIKIECGENIYQIRLAEKESEIAVEQKRGKEIVDSLAGMRNKLFNIEINNHFLFNTLNAIAAVALQDGSVRAYEAILNMSSLFRGKLHKSGALVSFRFEINNLETYSSLMKLRLYSRVKFTAHIAEDTADLSIPFNVLQPIVENCFVHAFPDYMEKEFNITVSSKREKNRMIVIIKDDGCGMSEETLLKMKEKDGDTPHGLKMIQTLLKHQYGDDFSVKVKSAVNRGTKFTINIPAIKYEEQSAE